MVTWFIFICVVALGGYVFYRFPPPGEKPDDVKADLITLRNLTAAHIKKTEGEIAQIKEVQDETTEAVNALIDRASK